MRTPRHRDHLFHAIVITRSTGRDHPFHGSRSLVPRIVITGRATLGVGFYHRVFGEIPKECDGHGTTAHAKYSRLKWIFRRSHWETTRSLEISAGAVASAMTRAKAVGLTWDTVGALSDDALGRTLYGPKLALTVARPGPDLLHLEYWPHILTATGSIGQMSLENATQTLRPDHSPKSSAFLQTMRSWRREFESR